MATFTKHELYGGAISCQLPFDYLDSSNFRVIPSHQEVWLSPTTLTNIITEINQYETSQSSDANAATYHFRDVIDANDTLQEVSRPTLVEMKSSSVAKFPAYTMSGVVASREKATAEMEQTWIYQLVVRMREVETDLCVRVNVPLKEFKGEEGTKEIQLGQDILGKVVESLEVLDFGLFEG